MTTKDREAPLHRVALIFANHAYAFASEVPTADVPGFSWGEFSAREKAQSLLAARAILDAHHHQGDDRVSATASSSAACPYCGTIHGPLCPAVKEIEYFPDGKVKRVEFKTAPDYQSWVVPYPTQPGSKTT